MRKKRLARLTARCRDVLVLQEQGRFSVLDIASNFSMHKSNRTFDISIYVSEIDFRLINISEIEVSSNRYIGNRSFE